MNDDYDEYSDADPFIGETEVIGLYPTSRAAAASKWTSTIGDSGNSSGLDD